MNRFNPKPRGGGDMLPHFFRGPLLKISLTEKNLRFKVFLNICMRNPTVYMSFLDNVAVYAFLRKSTVKQIWKLWQHMATGGCHRSNYSTEIISLSSQTPWQPPSCVNMWSQCTLYSLYTHKKRAFL